MKKIFYILLIFLTTNYTVQERSFISADNSAIDYMGRVDFSNPKAPKFNWPGVCVRFKFSGKSISVRLKGGRTNFFNVFIDKKLYVINTSADSVIRISNNLSNGVHTFELYKRTEANMGSAEFLGVYIDKTGKIMPWESETERKIMFIGNSITCGYGVEGKHKLEKFRADTENNYNSYGPILSRAFGADYHIIAHSGLGVVRQYRDKLRFSKSPQMPHRFEYTLDNSKYLKWDHSKWIPDIVVINLGTNDYSTRPHPETELFKRVYENFIVRIKELYNDVYVVCVTGPMVDEPCSTYVDEMVEDFKYVYNTDRITHVNLPIPLLNGRKDLGSDWHPSFLGHQKIARSLIPVISSIMNWDYYEIIVKDKISMNNSSAGG